MTLPQAERRLSAILVADVVGYSRLVEADESGTLAAIRDLRETLLQPLLDKHRGRIVKLLGDGLIAEFGSVVGAVACAATLQRKVACLVIAGIVLRIGINLGDVVAENDDLSRGRRQCRCPNSKEEPALCPDTCHSFPRPRSQPLAHLTVDGGLSHCRANVGD